MPFKQRSHTASGQRRAERAFHQKAYDAARRDDHRFYTSAQWLKVRDRVLRRDHFMCQAPGCGRSDEQMHVDHKLPRRTHPDLALDDDNLQTLCSSCHSQKTRQEERGAA